MTVYPNAIDDDTTLIRIDANLSEIGDLAINQLRSATFAIEKTLGINPQGSVTNLATFLQKSHNPDGTIKASALTSIGLATIPIVDNLVASNAGIKEFKLSLDYSTANLHTLIVANSALLNSLVSFSNTIFSDLSLHVSGAKFFADNVTKARHTISQIDINQVPSDSRDPAFTWTGLKDKTGTLRTATQAAQALQQINDDLVAHENAVLNAHPASAISVNTTNFIEIPTDATNAQAVFNYLDEAEVLNIGQHRATQHSNGIARISRSDTLILDGYGAPIVPLTLATTYLVHSPNTSPVDDLSIGDDIVKFTPVNTNFVFDSQFSQVKVGDIIRINYSNGIEVAFPIDSIRYTPGSEWVVRINGNNLFDSTTATARIDRPVYDINTEGILAAAAAVAHDATGPTYTQIMSSVSIANPRSAVALGLGFNAGKLDSNHYNLYLQIYPTGNPVDKVLTLPAIDVTGNKGITPGLYTLDSVVQSTNDQLRRFGFNYRMIAFSYEGEFGIMLTDCVNNVSFSIISGDNSSGTLNTGAFVKNVIGGNSLDDFDALGLGTSGINIASPVYQGTWSDFNAAQLPTKIISPLKRRFYTVNGRKLDLFAPTYLAQGDGYWDGYISFRNPISNTTVETTYTVLKNLAPAGLKPGKTILVQPKVAFTDGYYSDVDYGKFIIKSVNFVAACGSDPDETQITVINSLYATGIPFGFTSLPPLNVKLYFSQDTVSFDNQNIIDPGVSATNYSRFHEIYIDDHGHTFSHERGRMPRQSEDANKLGTSSWHIQNISPKLRGYTDGVANVFNKYVRLYISNYDTVSGQFDGYLGQRIPASPGILRAGGTVHGRKNVPVRFYDETNVDYIEAIYREDSPSPGTTVLSTASPRYVDIELFPSLEKDDELFLIASCELNWGPLASQDTIQYIKDRRAFGSISEKDITQSLFDVIDAGDKYLHGNGVIKGLDLASISVVPNSGEIFFNGGIALVNGKVLTVNNNSIVIPQVYPTGTSVPQTLNWAIGVNDLGNLESYILTATKQQFFATTGTGNWYLPSYTFQELVDNKKNFTVIAVANVTIASITINSVQDVRKNIISQTNELSLTWTGDTQQIANFTSFTALKNWIVQYGSAKNRVKVIGNVPVNTSIDLTGFTKEVLIDGSEGSFDVNVPKGLLVGSNLIFDSCTFNYNINLPSFSSISYVSGDEINSANGCLYGAAGTDISSFQVRNCLFTSVRPNQRPPFISLEMNRGQVNDKIVIQNNRVVESTPSSETQAFFANIALVAGADLTNPSVISNAIIADNICSHKQGIYVTTASVIASGIAVSPSPGLNSVNSKIRANNCGKIGFFTSSVENALASQTTVDRGQGLWIENNTCLLIANIIGNSQIPISQGIQYGTGNVDIIGNHCAWIFVNPFESISSNQYSSVKIHNNTLNANNGGFLISPLLPYAICVGDGGTYTNQIQVSIVGNNINFGRFDGTTYSYSIGIFNSVSAIIAENIVKGITATGLGISVSTSGSAIKRCNIINNQIYRGAVALTRYIALSLATNAEGTVTGNYFDSPTVDGSSTNTVDTPAGWIVERNKNQTQTAVFPACTGMTGLITGSSGDPITAGGSISTSQVTQANFFSLNYNTTGTQVVGTWTIPFSLLPTNVYIISATTQANVSTATPSTKTAVMYFYDQILGISAITSLGLTTSNQALTCSVAGYTSSPASGGYVNANINLLSASSALGVLGPLSITYRW